MKKIKVDDNINGFEPDYEQYIGRKMVGFYFGKCEYSFVYTDMMNDYISSFGVIKDIDYKGSFPTFYVQFYDKSTWHYPCELAIGYLVKEEENCEQYIGRKMQAFNFGEEYKNVDMVWDMVEKARVGKIGRIIAVRKNYKGTTYVFDVLFADQNNWSYPCELAIPHIINGEIEQPKTIEPETKPEMVNSPAHYGSGVYEVIEVIEAWGLDKDFNLGNAVKYIARYDKKGNPIEDLEKAIYYIMRKIKLLKKKK